MIQKIKSKRVELPPIFLIENEEDFKTLPKGLPYIVGSTSDLPFITVFLEFQVLYKSCLKTNLPIKWLETLQRLGYKTNNLKQYQLNSGGSYWENKGDNYVVTIDDFVEDQYLVNFDKLADVMIVAASNPQGLINLTPQIKERFIRFELAFDIEEYQTLLKNKYGMPFSVSKNISNLIQKEKFENSWDFITPRSIEKAINQIGCDIETSYDSLLLPYLSEKIKYHHHLN